MGSVFLNAGLAAGIGLAAIPVILHLFMKQTPKKILFPALRLVRERQIRSRKKLRLKNWLLLLARMALIALMALALARPSIDAKVKTGDEVEASMAMVFDTSLSMSYRDRDQSRLDEAKERASEVLKRARSGSKVFVIDSAEAGTPPPLSPAAARERVDSLEIRAANRSLNSALAVAYKAVLGVELPRREVFVFTDLARSAWNPDSPIEGIEQAKPEADKAGVATYLVRVAAPDPHDAAIVEAGPTDGLASKGDPVAVRARVRAIGATANRTVEFYVDGEKRGQQLLEIPADSEVDVPDFRPKLEEGLHRIEIRLAGEPDPLPFDDVRFLTFEVEPSLKVLVLADRIDETLFVVNALDPEGNRDNPSASRPFQVETVRTASLPEAGFGRSLAGYVAVFLLDVGTLKPGQWRELADYVRGGGGLIVGVGPRVAANVKSYNDEARGLMPATLGATKTHGDRFGFGRADLTNPLFGADSGDLLTELGRLPVFKTISVTPANDARTLLTYQGDGDEPALVERAVVGGPSVGRVLLWTTALARDPDPSKNWNEFAGGGNWAFFALMNRTIPYLTGTAGRRLAVNAGASVTLPIDGSKGYTEFNATPPSADAGTIRLNAPTNGGPLVVPALTMMGAPGDPIGQWEVTASGGGAAAKSLGFSVNPPPAESQLAPIEAKELDGLFGEDGYVVADDPASLERAIQETTIGREIYPWIMLLILLIVTAENALANTFYRRTNADGTVATPGTRSTAPEPASAAV